MEIIDSHVHLGTWKNPDFFARSLNADLLFRSMDAWGISKAVVMPTDEGKNEEILDSLEKFSEEKYRFVPWIRPGDKKALKFCDENLNKVAGLKFHPSLDKTKLTDASYSEAIDFAIKKDLPIFVHCGRWQEIAASRFPLEIASKNKGLKVVLSHMGGDTPKLAFETVSSIKEKKLDNVYLDTAGFREYWAIEKCVEDLGAQKFLFASDFPLGHPVSQMTMIGFLDIKDEEKQMILSFNAARLLNWEVKQ